MGSWRDYIDRVGVAAVEARYDRAVTPEEYMAVHTALEALVDHLILVPTMESEAKPAVVEIPTYGSAEIRTIPVDIQQKRREAVASAIY